MTDHRSAPHYIYRLYDINGGLLYIGSTVNVERRVREHRRKPWWIRVTDVQIEGPVGDYRQARRREDAAITAECPVYAMNGRQVGIYATDRRYSAQRLADAWAAA